MKFSTLFFLIVLFTSFSCRKNTSVPVIEKAPNGRESIAASLEKVMKENMISRWYPPALDSVDGGYLSTFDKELKPKGDHDKMIVAQSRHLWINSKASLFYESADYLQYARHGFQFLKNKMWDAEYGGFHWLVDKKGNFKNNGDKTAYGNAFGLYATSAYFLASKDTAALSLAKKSFQWLEKYSHDPVNKGYFQHLDRKGNPIIRTDKTPSTSDLGYKDQNSSIHLLEAFTELYQAWPDTLVKARLEEMIYLIRDKIVNEKGNLVLFFQPDWTPISFRDSSREGVMRHHNLDHVSWGHDIETAYLLMEAAHIAGWHDDTLTKRIAKKMTDQCFEGGWDDSTGGIFDEGYYFKEVPGVTVIRETKNWWTQSEALNTLLIMADMYPNDKINYFEKFKKEWSYIDTYLIDHKNGDWYDSGLDRDPKAAERNKLHIWKAGYHQYRSLENCIKRLRGLN